MPTFSLMDFSGGRDRRPVFFAGKRRNRFRELTNAFVNRAKQIQRRYPAVEAPGSFDALSQGTVTLNGVVHVISKKGEGTGVTIVDPPVVTLQFDNPDHATDWTLLQALVFDSKVVALIRHVFPGGVVTFRDILHVFDGSITKPTYVEDPFVPTNWAPTFPLHVFGSGMLGAVSSAFTPVMTVAGTKLQISRPDGNVGFSGVADARLWNTRTPAQFESDGEWWYFITPTTVGRQDFIVSTPAGELFEDQKWAAYVLEYCDSTGTWQRVSEVRKTPTADKTYRPTPVASRLKAGYAEHRTTFVNTTPITTTIVSTAQEPVVYINNRRYLGTQGLFTLANGTGAWVLTWTLTDGCANAQYLPAVGDNIEIVSAPTGTEETKLELFWNDSGGTILRFRPILRPTVVVKSGVTTAQTAFPYTILAGVLTFEGADVAVAQVVLAVGDIVDSFADRVTAVAAVVPGGTGAQAQPGVGDAAITQASGFMPQTGLQRYLSRILRMDGNTDCGTAQGSFAYQYGDAAVATFFTRKQGEYLNTLAGSGDAGFLDTASSNTEGGNVLAVLGVRRHLFVFYRAATQLWSVNADQTLDQLIDRSAVGLGNHTPNPATLVFNAGMVLSVRGFRLFEVSGFDSNSAEERGVGDPIEDFLSANCVAAVFWPWTGQFVAAVQVGAALEFHVFDLNSDAKIAAWSKWTIVGLTSIDAHSLVAVDHRLFFRSGTSLRYFDALATVFRDYADGVTAFQSELLWHQNDLDKPGLGKVFRGMDYSGTGKITMSFRLMSQGAEQTVTGPTLLRTSYGGARVALAMRGQSIAPRITSVDEAGFTLEAFALDFDYTKR